MSMKVNFNLSAILANDYLRKSDNALTKSMQKLSSGYKINDAGDSPSGIAIGRRMRAQIKQLSQAGQNASDAVSVVQTAEGALNEIHDMLQRMNELSIKAANGTMSGDNAQSDEDKARGVDERMGNVSTTGSVLTATDRAMVQMEIDQLIDEIERIASTTEFNGRKLLNGNFDMKGYVEKAENPSFVTAANDSFPLEAMRAVTVESYSDDAPEGYYALNISFGNKYEYTYEDVFDPADEENKKYSYTKVVREYKGIGITGLSFPEGIDSDSTIEVNGEEKKLVNITGVKEAYLDDDGRTVTIKGDNGFSLTLDVDYSKIAEKNDATGKYEFTAGSGLDGINGDLEGADIDAPKNYYYTTTDSKGSDVPRKEYVLVDKDGKYVDKDGKPSTAKVTLDAAADADKAAENKKDAKESTAFTIYINLTGKGAMTEQIGAEEGVTLDMRIPKISAKNLGVLGLNVLNADSARESIDRVSRAIDRLSEIRSRLGAYQNRLEHTIASLDATEESTTEAFSRIMDTDMAEEMTIYSQQQVMSQAGTSILAQANQRPSQILQLLQ